MKRFLACLALCASLSASAQDDNCTVLGIQDLTQMVFEFQDQLNAQDATIDSLQNAAVTRDSVRAIARAEAAIGGSYGYTDLSGANLSGMGLTGINLYGADLSGANLGNTNLSIAYLVSANLSGAYLNDANLSGAYLSSANLSGAIMTCLQVGCPAALPSGYICEPDTDYCPQANRYRIVPE